MKTRAAALIETGRDLEVLELEVPKLKSGQVLVEMAYSGVCHTQLLEARGHRGPDRFLPHCLGHEGSGRVLEAGPDAARFKAGDAVVLSWMKGGGSEGGGVVYGWGSLRVNAGPVATFGALCVASENRLSPIPKGVDFRAAALLGCAVPTGMGLVFNTLEAQAGRSLVVFGLGGIGLCAVAAGKLAGCASVVAVDTREDRRKAAALMGAAQTVEGGPGALEALMDLAPGGFDYAVEATGRPDVMAQALSSVRPRGGAAAVAGNARFGEKVALDPRELNLGKRLLGSWGGDNEPDRDFAKYAGFLAERRVNLSALLCDVYPLERVNEALSDLESGKALRPLLKLGSA